MNYFTDLERDNLGGNLPLDQDEENHCSNCGDIVEDQEKELCQECEDQEIFANKFG